jgi:hypothetical protein
MQNLHIVTALLHFCKRLLINSKLNYLLNTSLSALAGKNLTF